MSKNWFLKNAESIQISHIETVEATETVEAIETAEVKEAVLDSRGQRSCARQPRSKTLCETAKVKEAV